MSDSADVIRKNENNDEDIKKAENKIEKQDKLKGESEGSLRNNRNKDEDKDKQR